RRGRAGVRDVRDRTLSMLVVGSDAHRAHRPRRPFLDRGVLVEAPEIPERIDRIVAALADANLGAPTHPTTVGFDTVQRVHASDYLAFLEHAHEQWRAETGLGPDSEAAAYARAIRGQPTDEPPSVIGQLGFYSHDSDPVLAGTWEAATGAV